MGAGAKLFADPNWKNGYNLFGDYRDVTHFNPSVDDVQKLVAQDKSLNPHFDKSRFAMVAYKDIVFGIIRMWELLSIDNIIEARIFRDLDEALQWLHFSPKDFNCVIEKFRQ